MREIAIAGAYLADLTNKIVLVTGASGAIGSAIVASVKRAGGKAIASDLAGRPGIDLALDVTAEADWQRAMAGIERLDGLVNAAGIAAVGSIEKTDFATWRRVLGVNLDGTFLGCKYAFPLLRKQGGAIVNLSSVLGLIGGPNLDRLYRLERRGVAAHQIGGAQWRALQAAGALQRRVPGLRGRADGGRDRARHAQSRTR